MIALPAFHKVPAVYATAHEDAQAARCALLLAPKGPIAPPARGEGPVEQAQLEAQLEGWMRLHTHELGIFEPRLRLSLDSAPECSCTQGAVRPMSLWVMNRGGEPWHAVWRLDRRWAALQKAAPGMPAAALAALEAASRLGLPIYTPFEALGHCQWQHWYGEEDESEALENFEGPDRQAQAVSDGFPTRRWLEDKLPPIAKANSRALPRKRLEQTRGPRRDVARAIVKLLDAVKAHRPARGAPDMHTHQDELWSVGYGVTLRWNEADPMGQLYDDYTNGLYETFTVEFSYGWFPISEPSRLPRALDALERRFAIARAAERLIELIAEEVR